MSKLDKLKIIVSQEQSFYDKNDNSDWGYYNAYKFVLEQIDLLNKEKGNEKSNEWRRQLYNNIS